MRRLIHYLAFAMEKAALDKAKHKKFDKLVERLEELGESLDEAKEDLWRWKKCDSPAVVDQGAE